jgi:cytochrome c
MAKRTDNLLSTLVCAVVFSLFSTASLAGDRAQNEGRFPRGLQGDIEHGKLLFAERCVHCHGASGDGKGADAEMHVPKPISFQTEYFRSNFGRREIFTSIALGKLATHMPTWLKEVSDQDVADISEYVYQRFGLRKFDISY